MTMVLVPLDGTRVAERAVPLARSLAAWSGGDLLVVRSAWDCSRREVTAYLDDLVDRFDLHREASARVVEAYPADAVFELAQGQGDVVLVLATHGRSGLGHALIGSFGEEILARWPGPAFVVGPHPGAGRSGVPGGLAPAAGPSATSTVRAPGARGRLGWCVDAATDVTTVAPFVVSWATALDLDAVVVTVRAEDDRPLSRFHPASAAQLEDACAALRAAGVPAEAAELRELQPARALARYASERDLALLVAAKRSGSGVRRDLLGSTTMNLVHQSPCPVLVPPEAPHRDRSGPGGARS